MISVDLANTFVFYYENCVGHSFGRLVGVRVGVVCLLTKL